jgi:hypothetical protein
MSRLGGRESALISLAAGRGGLTKGRRNFSIIRKNNSATLTGRELKFDEV